MSETKVTVELVSFEASRFGLKTAIFLCNHMVFLLCVTEFKFSLLIRSPVILN